MKFQWPGVAISPIVLVPIFFLSLGLPGPARAEIPSGWPWKINHLVYPTLGYPAMVKRGESFTLEFDFVGRGEGAGQPAVSGWEAVLISSNDRFPTETSCPVESAAAVSARWPGDSTADYWKGSGPWAEKAAGDKQGWERHPRARRGPRGFGLPASYLATGISPAPPK